MITARELRTHYAPVRRTTIARQGRKQDSMTTPAHDMIASVVAILGSDDGSGDIGVIVRQALRDDPAATAEDIAAIVRDARADAAVERDRA